MAQPAEKLSTYEDLDAFPEGDRIELIDGDLIAMPRPTLRHSNSLQSLSEGLRPPFQRGRGGPGGWWILGEPEIRIDPDAVIPDLAGWRVEHLPEISTAAAATVAPDWVCEILSPGTKRVDRVLKLPRYARWGVGHAWLVDPIQRTLEVFALVNGRWTLILNATDDDLVRAEPFEAVELSLADWWVP